VSVATIGAGWEFPVAITPSGGVDVAAGVRKLEQSMRLILTTYPGERAMRPEFGSRLRDYVFAPTTPAVLAELAGVVRSALERWEPRAEIVGVEAYPRPEQPSHVLIDIAYRVRDEDEVHALVLRFDARPDEGGE
jgi:phage baseplate assembly protein W